MCTLILATRAWPDAPLVVASNRDERLDRPSEPPAIRRWGDRDVLAPLDVEGGGTWLGVNDAGVFVGVTNRFVMERDPDRASRGALVRAALEQADLPAAIACAEALSPEDYNAFHLVMADRTGAHCVWSDGVRLASVPLEAGVHVVTERSFDAAPSDRLLRWEERTEVLRTGSEPSLAQWEGWLGEHGAHPLEGTCVHWDERGYGTRSSFLLRVGGSEAHAAWREGPACSGRLKALEQEMRTLFQGVRSAPSVER
jgi:uncharacterized protein with NRDE domain